MLDHVLEKIYAQQELAGLQLPLGLDALVKEAVTKPIVGPREDAVWGAVAKPVLAVEDRGTAGVTAVATSDIDSLIRSMSDIRIQQVRLSEQVNTISMRAGRRAPPVRLDPALSRSQVTRAYPQLPSNTVNAQPKDRYQYCLRNGLCLFYE